MYVPYCSSDAHMGDSEHEVGKALKSIVLYGVIHPSSNFAKKKGGYEYTERISTANLKVARPCLAGMDGEAIFSRGRAGRGG